MTKFDPLPLIKFQEQFIVILSQAQGLYKDSLKCNDASSLCPKLNKIINIGFTTIMSTYNEQTSKTPQLASLNKSPTNQSKPRIGFGSPESLKNPSSIKQPIGTPLKHISPPAKLPEKVKTSPQSALNSSGMQSPKAQTQKISSLGVIPESPRKNTIVQPQSPNQKNLIGAKVIVPMKGRPVAPRMSEEPMKEFANKPKGFGDNIEPKKSLQELKGNRIRSPTEPEKANQFDVIRTRSPTSPTMKRQPRMSQPVNASPPTEDDEEADTVIVNIKEQSLINLKVEGDTGSMRFAKPKPSDLFMPKKSESPVKSYEDTSGAFTKKGPMTLTETVSTDSNSNSYRQVNRSNMVTAIQTSPRSPIVARPQSSSPKRPVKLPKIEDFVLGRQLGSGKFGSVYASKHKSTGFVCAIKVIPKDMVREQNIVNQLIREIKIQSCLDHPNITKLYGFFDDDKNVYLMLELGSSGQLYKVLKEKGRFSEQTASYLVKQICEAIRYIHTFKIIHRDIKPENIVLQHGIAKMCDFGWAVNRGSGLRSTFCGTPLYVSPEILKGENYDERIDLWSIGILTYQLLVGDIPFEINREEQLIKIIRQEVQFPSNIEVSEIAKDFVLKILQKNPNDRQKVNLLLQHPFLNLKQKMDASELEILNSNN